MPYASNGKISSAPIEGGIEISPEQYRQALAAMLEGKEVSIEDGQMVLRDPPKPKEPEPEPTPEPEPAPEPEPTYPAFTSLEMLDLFTESEQIAVVAATLSTPVIKLWYDRLLAASFVTYEDPRVEDGLQALVKHGLLSQQRKDEIVAAMQPQ
jgi:hypothetical protein